MAKSKDTTNETRERPGAIIEALRQAGVDRELTMRVFDCIEGERAETIAKAARLFYHSGDERGPMTLGEFSDEFHNMVRRTWGLVAAIESILDGSDDSVGSGVVQLVNDVARDMERLNEAFDAEHWIERHPAPQS